MHESVKALSAHRLPQLPQKLRSDLVYGVYIVAVARSLVEVFTGAEVNVLLRKHTVKGHDPLPNVRLALACIKLIDIFSVHGKALIQPRLSVLVVSDGGIEPLVRDLVSYVKAQALIGLVLRLQAACI